MNFRKKILGACLFLLLSILVCWQEAFAHARDYVWTEQYKTLPKNVFELENWVTFKVPDGGVTNANTIEYQEELEYGLTDHWNIAHYERWKTKNRTGAAKDSTTYKGFKFETKYRIGEKNKYWLDPLLYLEWATDPRDKETPNSIEGKIVLSKDLGKFNMTYNQIMESGLGRQGRTEHEYRVGMSYEIFSGFRVGGEAMGNYWKPSSHRNEISLGPSLAYENKYFWVASGVAFGTNNAADDFQARIILGVSF